MAATCKADTYYGRPISIPATWSYLTRSERESNWHLGMGGWRANNDTKTAISSKSLVHLLRPVE